MNSIIWEYITYLETTDKEDSHKGNLFKKTKREMILPSKFDQDTYELCREHLNRFIEKSSREL